MVEKIIHGVKTPTWEDCNTFLSGYYNRGNLELLSDAYFKPRKFEKNCSLYEKIGVPKLHKIASFNSKNIPKNSSAQVDQNHTIFTLKKCDHYTRVREALHSAGATMGCGVTYLFAINDQYELAAASAVLTFVQIPYILFQRYNRARVYNTIEAKIEECTGPDITKNMAHLLKITKPSKPKRTFWRK